MYGDWFAAKFRLRYVKNDAFHVFVTFIAIDWDLTIGLTTTGWHQAMVPILMFKRSGRVVVAFIEKCSPRVLCGRVSSCE
jgi:hypothetical protein